MSWSRQRIFFLAALILLAHIIAIFALHTPQPMVALPADFRAPRFKTNSTDTTALAVENGFNDPLVFAGAHEHGFSAAAWMMRPRHDYALTNSKPPPAFLAFSRTPTQFPPAELDTSIPSASALPLLQIAVTPAPRKSTLRIEGDLENRALIKVPEIPIQTFTDVLTNTVIQVAVKPDGFPFSARIITGSGSRAADLRGLEIANQLRFAPLPAAFLTTRNSADLQWGECVFQWFTVEPSVAPTTNTTPSGPKITAK